MFAVLRNHFRPQTWWPFVAGVEFAVLLWLATDRLGEPLFLAIQLCLLLSCLLLGILSRAEFLDLEEPEKPEEQPPTQPNPEPKWEAEFDYPFIEIAGGSFAMGSPEDEEGRYDDEGPVRIVELSPFAMGRFEVTRQLYSQVAAQYPELELEVRWEEETGAERLPANKMTWYEAVRFCNGLSKLAELQQVYTTEGESVEADWSANGYRLPTEAEWEYACRAGTTTRWHWGEGEDLAADHAWFIQNSGHAVHPVGGKLANSWGLQDMAGNVWEWCWDRFRGGYRGQETRDPKGSKAGGPRVLRGGAFFLGTRYLRSAYRIRFEPVCRYAYFGLRVVRSPVRQHS